MESLPFLVLEMRRMGVRRLELELEPEAPPTERGESKQWADGFEGSDTEQPPAEPKPEGSCAWGDCTATREGILGGIATQYCRAHAFQAAGVKT